MLGVKLSIHTDLRGLERFADDGGFSFFLGGDG